MKKFSSSLVLFLLVTLLLSGCFWRTAIETSEVGLEMGDGVSIDRILPSGRYTDMGYYAELIVLDASALTLDWTDPDLVTNDKQPVGLTLGITFARMRDKESVTAMWESYRPEAKDNAALIILVRNKIPRVAKAITAQFTLDEMLGIASGEDSGRELVAQELFDLLEPKLAEIHVELIDVGINNISPSESYLALLQQKADAQVRVEVAVEQAAQLVQELIKEQRQTDIEIEQARRENLVNEELAKTFETSPEFFELERLRLLADVIGSSDKIYFIPEGADLTLWLTGQSVAPVQP